MFALRGIILSFFGWLMLYGSSGLTTLPSAAYVPVDSLTATEKPGHPPLFFDAVLDVNHSSTHETPIAKIVSHTNKGFQIVEPPLFYESSYYAIGQQIDISLSVKTIIFPFHCFT